SADQPDDPTLIQALTFTVSGLSTVVLSLLLFRFLRSLVPEVWALTVTVGYSLGTIAFPFATMYFGHAASTGFLFAAFYALWRARTDAASWRPFLAGALVGYGTLIELPVALAAALLLVYALWLNRRSALLFIAGGLPML